MIGKIILNPNGNLAPAVIEWDDKEEDYVVNVPDGITRYDLNLLIDEINRITRYEKV